MDSETFYLNKSFKKPCMYEAEVRLKYPRWNSWSTFFKDFKKLRKSSL